MATEQAQTLPTESGSFAKWASWLAAILGLWVLVSPFVLTGEIATGTPILSNVIAGILVLVLGGFGAYTLRTTTPGENEPAELGGWIAAIAGLWILVSPFVLSGEIASGTPLYSNVVAGFVALVLAAYAGLELHGTE